MNLIVKFMSEEAREEFIRHAKETHPRLLEKSHITKRRPDLIIEALREEDRSIAEQLAKGLGRVFEDVKFETMEPR